MFCVYCGAKLVDGAKFCTKCGHAVTMRPGQAAHPASEAGQTPAGTMTGDGQTPVNPMTEVGQTLKQSEPENGMSPEKPKSDAENSKTEDAEDEDDEATVYASPQIRAAAKKMTDAGASQPGPAKSVNAEGTAPDAENQKTGTRDNGSSGNSNARENGCPGNLNAPGNGYPGNLNAPGNGYPGNSNAPGNGYPGNSNAPGNGYPGNLNAPGNGYPGNSNAPGNGYSWNQYSQDQPWKLNNTRAQADAAGKPKNSKRKKKKAEAGQKTGKRSIAGIIIAIVIIVILAALAAGYFLFFYKSGKIDLSSYMKIECSGYDGYGTAKADFDYDSFEQDNKKLIEKAESIGAKKEAVLGLFSKKDETGSSDTDAASSSGDSGIARTVEFLAECGSLDKTDGLSNGDEVTYHFEIDDSDLDYAENLLGCTLIYSDVKQEVDGLEPAEETDPFDGMITVGFTGKDGQGKASAECSDDLKEYVSVTVDPAEGLSNGDKVTVTVTPAEGATDASGRIFIEKLGEVLTVTSKEFTVKDLTKVTAEADKKTKSSEDSGEEDTEDGEDKGKEDTEEDNLLDQDYIIPDSNKRKLTDKDVEGLTIQEINYAKNEIYARHGRKFKSKELQDYFNSKDWYKGTVDPDDFKESTLSAIEQQNASFLANKEFSMEDGGYKLDQKESSDKTSSSGKKK